MKVLVRGEANSIKEFSSRFDKQFLFDIQNAQNDFIPANYEVIFDFTINESPENLEDYSGEKGFILLVNCVKTSLSELSFFLDTKLQFDLFGFNGLPTFFNRELLEVTMLKESSKEKLDTLSLDLGFNFQLVADRVGMVSPRIICMIINEAYFTVQEGTTDKESIDRAMKLGSNYPYGPFEWATKIGIDHIFELLEAVYVDTHDERYKVCPLLKREYLLEVNAGR